MEYNSTEGDEAKATRTPGATLQHEHGIRHRSKSFEELAE
jgi:hypothetical protein